jgi:hypothetical protein
MAFGVLGASLNTTPVNTPVGTWVDIIDPLNITAPGGLAQFQGFVGNFNTGELLLQVLLDSVVVATGDNVHGLMAIVNVAAGAHTVRLQGYWTGTMSSTTMSASDQGLSVISLA